MAHIDIVNAGVDFPVYGIKARSIRRQLLDVARSGNVGTDSQDRILVRALSDLNIHIADGESIGIIGPNGAGKSTLLRLIRGIYEPTTGTVFTRGIVGSLIDITYGTDPEATGRDNIYLHCRLLGMSKSETLSQMKGIIDFTGLNDVIDMPLRTYSTGMHLRLAFTVATIIKPEILLMDEWLSVGDDAFRAKAEQRLSEILDSTAILVIASHSRELIEKICNRVIWLDNGRVVMDGSPKKVCDEYFS